MRSEFKELFENQTAPFSVEQSIVIDRVLVTLYLELIEDGAIVLTFRYNDGTNVYNEESLYFKKEEDGLNKALDQLEQYVLHGQFWCNELVLPEEYKIRKAFHQYLNAVKGNEAPRCYVCMEETEGHMTECNHDICWRCLNKSIKRLHDDDNDECERCLQQCTMGFRCGVCRKVTLQCDCQSRGI